MNIIDRIFSVLGPTFIIVIVFLTLKLWDYYQKSKRKEMIAWSILKNDNNREFSDMVDAIMYVQNKLCIPAKYQIERQERVYVVAIIDAYRDDVVQLFFSGKIAYPKVKGGLSGIEFFMYALQAVIYGHLYDNTFCGKEMRDKSDMLTDFAIVVIKMFIIAQIYCNQNKTLNPDGDVNSFSDYYVIEKSIDSRKL